MNIYIDESGIFTEGISCQGALIIPERSIERIISSFDCFKKAWGIKNEVKGKNLNEIQIDDLVGRIEKEDILFMANVIDMNYFSENDVEIHKTEQEKCLTRNLKRCHHPDFRREIYEHAEKLKNMKSQSYIQNVALTNLTDKVLRLSIPYYACRYPEELSNFTWMIDAKGNKITSPEEWWLMLYKGFISTNSERSPLPLINELDYSHFKDYILPGMGHDLNRIFSSLHFANSSDEVGLQIIDILINALRRALRGNLQPPGWRKIGRLMIREYSQNISFLSFSRGCEKKVAINPPYARIVKYFNKIAKPMVRK